MRLGTFAFSNRVVVPESPVWRRTALLAIAMGAVVLCMAGCKPDTTPPGNVTGITVSLGAGQITLAWTNPTDEDFAGVQVVRKTGGYPANATDGTTVYTGLDQTYTDTGLTNGTLYYYMLFAFDGKPNYASGVQASGIPTVAGATTEVLDQYQDAKDFIAGVPDTELTPEQRNNLTSLLDEAEGLYRGGDPCGAANAVLDFLAAAQVARQGAGIAAAEEAYNEGRMIRFNMMAGNPAKDACPGSERIGVESTAAADDQANDETQCVADFSFGEPKMLTEHQNGESYTRVIIPGAESEMGEPGDPGVPMFRRLVAVPEGATVQVDVTPGQTETIQCNLYPFQPPLIAGSPVAPSFTKSDKVYNSGGVFPPQLVNFAEIGRCRDLRLIQVEAAAAQYDTATSTLTMFTNLNINVTFNGGNGTFVATPATEGFETSFALNPRVLNAAITGRYAGPRAFQPNGAGEELLILTHPDFHDAAIRLATWKNTKGIITNVFDVCDGAGAGPDTNDAIKQFIRNRYDTKRIRVSYVLLMGDSEFIPIYSPAHHFNNADYGCATIGTDWFYGTRADTDMLASFAVGRIPVDTLAQANTVVDKLIGYEQTPPNNNTFYSTASLVSYFECCKVDTRVDGVEAMGFISDTEWDLRNLRRHGYTVERIYTETVNRNYPASVPPYRSTVPQSLRGGEEAMPSDIAPASGFQWNGNATTIANAFNNGRFFIMYVDHGNVDGWGNPAFWVSDINASVHNTNLLPVVFSMACQTGNFDNEVNTYVNGTSPTGVYFAETLLRKADGGAVGVIAATRNSMLAMYLYLQKGFADAIWPDSVATLDDAVGLSCPKKRLGDILNYGKAYMVSQASAQNWSNKFNFIWDSQYVWHVIGDPTLEMWTENPYRFALPAGLTVENDFANQRIIVHYAVEGAVITGFQSNEPIGRGIVHGGIAYLPWFNEEPSEILGIDFAVNVKNFVPFRTTAYLPDTIGPWPVTGLNAIPGNARVDLTWTNPEVDFDHVKVFRTLGAPVTTPPALPELMRYQGAAEAFTDTIVNNGMEYCYTLFAYDAAGNWSTPVSACTTPFQPDIDPPSNVSQFTAVLNAGQVVLNWQNPPFDFAGVTIQRRTDQYPTSHTDGTNVYEGTAQTFTDTGVSDSHTYYYTAFAHDGIPNYAPGAQAQVAYPDITPPANITGLSATNLGVEIQLAWTNPGDKDFAGVRIVRKDKSFPTSITDGTVVYSGDAEGWVDFDVSCGTTYYYKLFAFDEAPNYASGVTISSLEPCATEGEGEGEGEGEIEGEPPSWQNAANALDINGDGAVTPLDVLAVINNINASGSRLLPLPATPPPYLDANGDGYVSPIDVLRVINALNAKSDGNTVNEDNKAADAPRLRVEVQDLTGKAASTIDKGDDFHVAVYVQNTTVGSMPVFAAYFNMTYNSELITPKGGIEYGPEYPNGHTGDFSTPGLISEVGAFDGTSPMQPDEQLLLTLTFTANETGQAQFHTGMSEKIPQGDMLVFGQNTATDPALVDYGSTSINIVTPAEGEGEGDTTPPADVTDLSATDLTIEVQLFWTNPTDSDFAGVKILKKEGTPPTSNTDGTVVDAGNVEGWVDFNVTCGHTYYYVVYAYDTSMNAANGKSISITPQCPAEGEGEGEGEVDTTPPADVTDLSATDLTIEVQLFWTNPTDSDFAGVKILKKEGTPPTSNTDGTVVDAGNVEGWVDFNVTCGHTYYYVVYAYDTSMNDAGGKSISVTPQCAAEGEGEADTTPPGPVIQLTADPTIGAVYLNWINPTDADFAGVRIQRGENDYPQTVTEGANVYDGTASEFNDTGVTDGIPYFYSVFAYDGVPNYAAPAQVSATPGAGSPQK